MANTNFQKFVLALLQLQDAGQLVIEKLPVNEKDGFRVRMLRDGDGVPYYPKPASQPQCEQRRRA